MGILISYIYFPPYWLPAISQVTAPTLQDITTKGYIDYQCDRIRLFNESPTKEILKDYIKCQSDIYGYDWDLNVATNIAWCESTGNVKAHNFSDITKDDSWGLFQINRYGKLEDERPTSEWLKIPENNISYAYELYQSDGWNHWKNCL